MGIFNEVMKKKGAPLSVKGTTGYPTEYIPYQPYSQRKDTCFGTKTAELSRKNSYEMKTPKDRNTKKKQPEIRIQKENVELQSDLISVMNYVELDTAELKVESKQPGPDLPNQVKEEVKTRLNDNEQKKEDSAEQIELSNANMPEEPTRSRAEKVRVLLAGSSNLLTRYDSPTSNRVDRNVYKPISRNLSPGRHILVPRQGDIERRIGSVELKNRTSLTSSNAVFIHPGEASRPIILPSNQPVKRMVEETTINPSLEQLLAEVSELRQENQRQKDELQEAGGDRKDLARQVMVLKGLLQDHHTTNDKRSKGLLLREQELKEQLAERDKSLSDYVGIVRNLETIVKSNSEKLEQLVDDNAKKEESIQRLNKERQAAIEENRILRDEMDALRQYVQPTSQVKNINIGQLPVSKGDSHRSQNQDLLAVEIQEEDEEFRQKVDVNINDHRSNMKGSVSGNGEMSQTQSLQQCILLDIFRKIEYEDEETKRMQFNLLNTEAETSPKKKILDLKNLLEQKQAFNSFLMEMQIIDSLGLEGEAAEQMSNQGKYTPMYLSGHSNGLMRSRNQIPYRIRANQRLKEDHSDSTSQNVDMMEQILESRKKDNPIERKKSEESEESYVDIKDVIGRYANS